MNRALFLKRLEEVSIWDFIVIGGGASGLGIAVDAASRGFSVLLLERYDFAKGTSSRSTKLIHGGVRYLAQGNIRLVYEALHERGILVKNAPHLVKRQSFIIPCYNWFQKIKYWVGLKLYDWLSGRFSLGSSVSLNRNEVIAHAPNVMMKNLVGGIQYFDAQFDDARLAISLAQTAVDHGALVVNYCEVTSLIKNDGKICGVAAVDVLNGRRYILNAQVVVNATGVFVDDILKLNEDKQNSLTRPSQGIHLVLENSFLKTNDAILIPKTSDNRVLFIVPWHRHVLLGTTDTPIEHASSEPIALEQEIDFVLNTAKEYLSKAPERQDVLSVFAGLRPLAALSSNTSTREISRNHKILISDSGLITVVGGKWTTYRKMAEDVINAAIRHFKFKELKCKTREMKINGYKKTPGDSLFVYGSNEEKIHQLVEQNPGLDKLLSSQFSSKEAHVVWAVREEMAMTVEDILSRRLRILFLNAREAMKVAPRVAVLMAEELHQDEQWIESQVKSFTALANQFLVNSDEVVSYARD